MWWAEFVFINSLDQKKFAPSSEYGRLWAEEAVALSDLPPKSHANILQVVATGIVITFHVNRLDLAGDFRDIHEA